MSAPDIKLAHIITLYMLIEKLQKNGTVSAPGLWSRYILLVIVICDKSRQPIIYLDPFNLP